MERKRKIILIGKPRIILVDDEKDIVEIFKKGLQHGGYQVDAFSDPIEALQQFKPYRYDVLITDIRMPGLNGFDLYRLIRKQDENIKVYFISAIEYDLNGIKGEFSNLQNDAFISKPVSIEKLALLLEG